jgi:hypothetical protein
MIYIMIFTLREETMIFSNRGLLQLPQPNADGLRIICQDGTEVKKKSTSHKPPLLPNHKSLKLRQRGLHHFLIYSFLAY